MSNTGKVLMPIQRAKKVLKEYEASNFNATVALQKAGYTQQTATKASKDVINRAIKKVAQEEIEQLVASSNPMGTLLQRVGMTRELLMGEYLKIIFQDKDMSNKLKAMMPLLKPEGIAWDDEQQRTAPTLNLTVKSNIEPSKPMPDAVVTDVSSVEPVSTGNTSEDMSNKANGSVLQSDNTAQQSQTIEHVGKDILCDVTTPDMCGVVEHGQAEVEHEGGAGVGLSAIAEKEGVSPTSKICEIGTIDKL